MSDHNTKVGREGWRHYEASMALFGCVSRFHSNRALITNLEDVFAYLCEELEVLGNYRHSLHLFVNNNLPELHVLNRSRSDVRYKKLGSDDKVVYQAVRKVLTSPIAAEHDIPLLWSLDADELREVLQAVGETAPSGPTPNLVIGFRYGVLDLGTFVLWEPDNPPRAVSDSRDEALLGWLANYYKLLSSLLTREYSATEETYLPSYFSARWSRAAILFADIRNFTPLTEVLRHVYARLGNQETEVFRQILNRHCEAMARIIQSQNGGRVDKFLGDGIMAIFGEHEVNPSRTVCTAIHAACQMILEFRQLKDVFLRMALGGAFETEYNESVDLDLGIGIDYGTVLFEYLGDEVHREFTAVGDHVNFAQRLESNAARFDPGSGMLRPSILISPTAERCVRPWLHRRQKISLVPKGLGRAYTVYGLEPEDFHLSLFETSRKHGDYTTPWENDPSGPPELGPGE